MLRRFAVLSALALLIGSLSAGWPAQASRRSIPGVDARLSPDDGHLTLFLRHVPQVHGWLLERATLNADAHA